MNKNNTKQALIRLEADCPINNFELISYELIEMGAGAIEEGDILEGGASATGDLTYTISYEELDDA